MNRERIEETVRLWQAEPDKAKGKAWQERCPVYLALTKALPVTTSLDIKRS
jgi:hypothetical protein